MCVACTEFIKGSLTFREFNSALRETTMDDAAHLLEVERALRAAKNDAEAAKKKLSELSRSSAR